MPIWAARAAPPGPRPCPRNAGARLPDRRSARGGIVCAPRRPSSPQRQQDYPREGAMAADLVIDIPTPIDVRIVRATVDAVKGWAVRWGHPRRRFRQAVWFATREQADRLVAHLR